MRKKKMALIAFRVHEDFKNNLVDLAENVQGIDLAEMCRGALLQYSIDTREKMNRARMIKAPEKLTAYEKKQQAMEEKIQATIARYDEVIMINGEKVAVNYDDNHNIIERWPLIAMRESFKTGSAY